MSNKVYVGNLPYSFTNDDLRNLFAAYGAVRLAEVILDRMTNRSRGFGFVEMDSGEGVQQVIRSLHETELQGRRLTVTEARDRVPGPGGGGPRFDAGPRPGGGFAAPRASGGGGSHAGPRAAGNGWNSAGGGGGGGPSWSNGRSGPQRGGGRPKRDEGDRWSDGGGRRRRPNDDFGDE